MSDKIKIMIVDDIKTARDNIAKLIELEPGVEVVAEAENGEEAVKKAKELMPDIILMDMNMPIMNGIKATEFITGEAPECSVVMISIQGEQEYLRQAMFAGAKDFLVKPFDGDELLNCIQQIYLREQKRREKFIQIVQEEHKEAPPAKIITVFSSKGGVGKTTIAANMGIEMALNSGEKVAIVDLDLQFGDVAMFMNVVPQTTIADLIRDIDNLDKDVLNSYLTGYSDQVKILAAPVRPEQAEAIKGEHIKVLLNEMKKYFHYIIVDTAPLFNEINITALDLSDVIILTTSQDLPTLKNVKLGFEILASLGYTEEKCYFVLNRADSLGGITITDAEGMLQKEFFATLPSDGKTVVTAVNQGSPFVVSNPDTEIAQRIKKLAIQVMKEHNSPGNGDKEIDSREQKKNKLGWLFGNGDKKGKGKVIKENKNIPINPFQAWS